MHQQPAFPPNERARNHSHAKRDTPGRRPTEIPSLEDAIIDLYDSVDDAIQYFSHFEQDFRQDTHRIRNYCDKGLLEAIWASKVHPQTSAQRSSRTHSEAEANYDGHETCRGTMKQLLSALGAALAAAEDFRPSQRRPSRYSPDDAMKIRVQLHRSYQNLRKSFSMLTQRRSEMETVNTELEMLRVFLSRNGAEEREVGNGRRQAQAIPDRQMNEGVYERETAWEGTGEQVEEWDGGHEGGQGESLG